MNRCPWCLMNELETKYHDEEWGVPVHDDRKQFEYLMLEVMQCGLSWDTVLKKREIFRACFDQFDYDKIASYTEQDIERIMNTPGVIRSRRKIEAVISNARCFRQIREECGSFSDYLWGWTGGKTLLYRGHELGRIPASNELSERIGRDLKKRGMKYLGAITVYAHLQASGVINDHLKDCHCYQRLIDQYPVVHLDETSKTVA
ncbi:MAG: DNA-3-methyladenine glycosylase I [Christensenellaceae bacterium]|nr:DNA-3-methyladenine glycosylase I [Christensenellaceae bacterium]